MNYISTFTNSLTGAALDYAVCRAQYPKAVMSTTHVWLFTSNGEDNFLIERSTDWAIAGPIMDCENIWPKPHISPRDGKHFYACKWNGAGDVGSFPSIGKTPLIAAMRCYVNSKLGATVDIPEELL